MKPAVGVAEEHDIDVPGPPLAFHQGIIMMHPVLVTVDNHEPHPICFKCRDALTIDSPCFVNVPVYANDQSSRRDIHVEKVADAITAMDEDIEGFLPGEDPRKLGSIAMGI